MKKGVLISVDAVQKYLCPFLASRDRAITGFGHCLKSQISASTLRVAYLQAVEGLHHGRQENSHNSMKNLSLNNRAFPAYAV